MTLTAVASVDRRTVVTTADIIMIIVIMIICDLWFQRAKWGKRRRLSVLLLDDAATQMLSGIIITAWRVAELVLLSLSLSGSSSSSSHGGNVVKEKLLAERGLQDVVYREGQSPVWRMRMSGR